MAIEKGYTLRDYDDEDFFEMQEVLSAKERKDRVQDPASLLPPLGNEMPVGGVSLGQALKRAKANNQKGGNK